MSPTSRLLSPQASVSPSGSGLAWPGLAWHRFNTIVPCEDQRMSINDQELSIGERRIVLQVDRELAFLDEERMNAWEQRMVLLERRSKNATGFSGSLTIVIAGFAIFVAPYQQEHFGRDFWVLARVLLIAILLSVFLYSHVRNVFTNAVGAELALRVLERRAAVEASAWPTYPAGTRMRVSPRWGAAESAPLED